jgi:hypothetical protein
MKFSKMARAGLDELADQLRANDCGCDHCRKVLPKQLTVIDKACNGADMEGEELGEIVAAVDSILKENESTYADAIAMSILTDLHMRLCLPHNQVTWAGVGMLRTDIEVNVRRLCAEETGVKPEELGATQAVVH